MRMQVEVPDSLWEQFKLVAKAKNQTASKAIRDLMETYITPEWSRGVEAIEEHTHPNPLDDDLGLALPPGVQKGVAGLKRGR